ncbi:MAG: nucleotide exchange factor GrpE [Thermodesulfobacteriota bacterium]
MTNDQTNFGAEEIESSRDGETRNDLETVAAVEAEPDWRLEAGKYRDLYLRSQADMDNMKKRLEREKADFIRFANENLIKDLLPLLDNLDRALRHAQQGGADNGFVEGVRLTYEGVLSVLDRFGLKSVAAAGERFDPNFHEAVMERENPEVDTGTILEEIQKGYTLHGRLIRPAMVVVSRRPASDSNEIENNE